MFDFIPIRLYTPIFFNSVLLLVLITNVKLLSNRNYILVQKESNYTTVALLVAVILYIGLRPVSAVFVDMTGYNKYFLNYARGVKITSNKDYYWHVFVKFCSSIMTAKMFFVSCAFLYIFPLYITCKKWFKGINYIPFLMLIASFSFWGAGVNGIRNGIATSIFVFGLSLDQKNHSKYIVFLICYLIHGSMLIPFSAFVLTLFFNKTNWYITGWFLAIALSLILGDFWESFFSTFDIGGNRGNYLTSTEFDDQFSSTGFRWDFLLYSASAVFAGYYFIFRKKFEDKLYQQLFNIYLTANAFWILVIRASFSNRFAYLSWFMMAIIIFYPFFKQRFFENQQQRLALIITLYFGFTYFMTF
ncbi:MAG: hypothetical protein DA407_07930 [Bacteroidetes bacterium]|nr:MAG: hypothetical protein DA407_07930 [Bacteroidota bacterium]